MNWKLLGSAGMSSAQPARQLPDAQVARQGYNASHGSGLDGSGLEAGRLGADHRQNDAAPGEAGTETEAQGLTVGSP